MEDNRKKVVAPLIIGILCMFILLGGATYAYFVTNTTNSFGTKTITGQADATGSVALIGTNASLYLNLDRTLMAQGANDTTYWAVTTNTTPSTTQNVVTVGSTSVNGAGYFNCNYTLNVAASATNNMYTAFQGMSGKSTEQIVLNVGGNTYDFNTASLFPITVSGTLNGVSASSVQNITAEFYLKNKSSVNQRALAGTDLTLTITATSFTCTQVEDPNDYLDKTRFTNRVNAGGYKVQFLNTTNIPTGTGLCDSGIIDASVKQNGSIVMSFIDDDPNCSSWGTIYVGQNGGVKLPPDSSSIFQSLHTIIGLSNIDTSHVTNMSYMFHNFGESNHIQELDLSSFNTSNVTNMAFMFYETLTSGLNLANWNTSHVANMRGMFNSLKSSNNLNLDLSSFDTSNATDLSYMFTNTEGVVSIDISSFTISNPEDMDFMFADNEDLTTIYSSNSFVMQGYYEDFFTGSESLIGGNGTAYDPNFIDSNYARIDAPGTPGYFTLKS